MDVQLSCACGAVKGVARNVTPQNGSRVVCCCDDCQQFANHLQRGAEILDEFGGTEIYQTSQSQVNIETGAEHIQCLRLKPKGLYRWYASCCNTPMGNTMNAGMPFFGIIHGFIADETNRDEALGKILAYVQTQHALGTPNYPTSSKKFPLGITLRIMRKILGWKIRGLHKPSAFFTDSGRAIVKPIIVNESG